MADSGTVNLKYHFISDMTKRLREVRNSIPPAANVCSFDKQYAPKRILCKSARYTYTISWPADGLPKDPENSDGRSVTPTTHQPTTGEPR